MPNLGYISVPALLKYLRHAEHLGLDNDAALLAAGINGDDLYDNSKRLPVKYTRTFSGTLSKSPTTCFLACMPAVTYSPDRGAWSVTSP